jgi:hypothetical protein
MINPLAPSAESSVDSSEAGTLAAALETFRVAIMAGDGKILDSLVHERLRYGHSNGHLVQSKSEFIDSLAGKTCYRSLAFSDARIEVVGNNAIVEHIWLGADILVDGSIGRSHIKVMQVWRKDGEAWKILARHSCPFKS